MTLPFLSVGAVGVIGVATHWCAAEMGEMIAAFAKGDVERARELNARLLPSFAYETSDATPNPLPTKVMLELLGQPVGECRLPMGPPPAGSGRPRPGRSPRASACSSRSSLERWGGRNDGGPRTMGRWPDLVGSDRT